MKITNDNFGERIYSLEMLYILSRNKKSVILKNIRCFGNHKPAAFMINMSGSQILKIIESGLYVYIPHQKGESK